MENLQVAILWAGKWVTISTHSTPESAQQYAKIYAHNFKRHKVAVLPFSNAVRS